jgi:eukaryotic-like serine/threonine-protein kinase
MAQQDEPLVRVGERVGGYEVLEALGKIGIADRFLVRRGDGTERVLGVVGARHPGLVARLRDAHLERVRHPNLVGVIEIVDVGAQPGVVTERFAGPTLRAWGDASHRHDVVLATFRSLVEGVRAAHEAGFVHRDLRPETVIVEGTTTPAARLLDLGVASAMFDLTTGARSVTTSGTIIGRPHYWAPERARRPTSADVRSDLFSLGCILYELLCGEGPFGGLNLYDCYHATLEERFVPLEVRCPRAPPALLSAVAELLRADPERRIQSCAELLLRLDRSTLGDEQGDHAPTPVPAEPAREPEPPAAPTPSWIRLAAGLACVAVLSAVLWAVLGR